MLADPDLARAVVYADTYENPERLSDEEVRAFLEPIIGSLEAGRQFERLLTSLRADDLLAVEPALNQLRVPTLIVWGTGDTFFPDERAEELVPHLRRHWAEFRNVA